MRTFSRHLCSKRLPILISPHHLHAGVPHHVGQGLRKAGTSRPQPRHVTRAEEKDRDSDESLEKLLWKELEKRGIKDIDDLQRRERQGQTSTRQIDPSPMEAAKVRSQLEESRKLNSEGLEGLIPRAKQLAALGGSFFLAFWPFLVVLSASFTLVFLLSGEKFIHGGRPGYTKYVSPQELLNEPTVDERIPYQ